VEVDKVDVLTVDNSSVRIVEDRLRRFA